MEQKPIPSPHPLLREIFRYQNLFETQKGSATTFSDNVRQEIFDGKSRSPPHIPKFLPYQKPLETQKGSPTNFFETVRQENFDGKRDTPAHPLQPIKFFSTPDIF